MALCPARARWTPRAYFLGCSLLALTCPGGGVSAQTQLPEVVVSAPKQKPKPRRVRATPASTAPVTPAAQLNAKADAFDQARSNITRRSARPPTPSATTPSRICRKAPTAGRASAAASPGRLAGFRGQRLAACPQRSRQCSVPDQRDLATRRRHRLRQHLRHQLYRQHVADHRRPAGRIRAAHHRPRRHHDAHRSFQQQRQRRRVWRQPWHRSRRASNMAARSAATAPRPRQPSRLRKSATRRRGLLCRSSILLHRPLSAEHGGDRKSDALLQRDSRFHAAGKGLRLYVRVRRPDHAGQPDRRNLEQQLSDSRSFPASRSDRAAIRRSPTHSARPVSTRRCSTKTRPRPPNSACCRCRNPSTASTGNCPISPATTTCSSRRTRSAIS